MEFQNALFVQEKINELRREYPSVDKFITVVEQLGELIFIGGAVRDILFHKQPRDWDIILVCDPTFDLTPYLSSFTYRKNSFGGYKLNLDGIEFDLWSIHIHWAFRIDLMKAAVENISKTVFFNIDTVLYFHRENKLLLNELTSAVQQQELDIILSPSLLQLNPQQDSNVLRAFVLSQKYNLQMSKKTVTFISNWVSSVPDPIPILLEIQNRHYKKQLVSERELSQWLSSL